MKKICSKCNIDKSVNEFPKNKAAVDGLHSWCKACNCEHNKLKRHKERMERESLFLDFGKLILNGRVKKSLTEENLADLLKEDTSNISLWEAGKTLPKGIKFVSLVKLLDIEIPLKYKRNKRGFPLGARLCRTCKKEFPFYRKTTIYCSHSCSSKDCQLGDNSHRWKTGRIINTNGYVKVKARNHPYADCKGYIYEHRLVMEKFLGRQLEPQERVHHKNGVRNDNNLSNLELWTLKKKDPAGIRAADYHCAGCRCFNCDVEMDYVI